MIGLSLSLSQPRSGGGVVYDNTNTISILSSSAVSTTPTNNIDPNGYIAAVTFPATAIGQTLTASKISLTYLEPAFTSAGAATTVSRTATGTAAMIMPVPAVWTTATVYAAGARCINPVGGATARIYSTVAGGTSGATPPTHTTGSVSDGGVTWLYLSDCLASTANTATVPVEAVSGADAVVYVVLDRFISSGATSFTYNIQAGAYGSSTASLGNAAAITNNATFAPLKPHVVWVTPPWERTTGTKRAEISVTHPHGQSSRMAAAVKFTVYNDSNVATAVTSTVTSMTQSTYLTTTYGNPVPVFAADLDCSGLADGMYSIRAQVFPFIGAEWDSDVDGFGSTGTWSISTVMPGNNAKRIPFDLDKDSSTAIYYAAVDGVGAAPAVSTTEATARTTPYATIVAAANALQAAGGSLSGQVIDILGGTTLTAFGATMDSGASKVYGTTWLTIRKYPGDGGVATINPDTVTAANRICGKRVKFSDVTIAGSTSAVIDNAEAATTGVVAHEVWLDNCIITGNNSQQPISRAGWLRITNSDMSGTATMTGANRGAWQLLAGSRFSGAGVTTNFCSSANALGNKFISKARITEVYTRYWSENSQALASQVYAFNSWYNATQDVFLTCQSTGSNDGGTTATTIGLTQGTSWVSNLIECMTGGSKGGDISGGGVVVASPMIYNMFNTAPGDGQNIAYNDTGTTQVKKLVISKFNFFKDRNMKDGFYAGSAGNATNPNRTGNYAGRFAVEWLCNIIYSATLTTPSASNNAGNLIETRSLLTGTAGFTNDQSGGGTGNGNYVPTSSSSAYNRIGATEQMLPFDLNGTTRKTDGTGAAGAFEWA